MKVDLLVRRAIVWLPILVVAAEGTVFGQTGTSTVGSETAPAPTPTSPPVAAPESGSEVTPPPTAPIVRPRRAPPATVPRRSPAGSAGQGPASPARPAPGAPEVVPNVSIPSAAGRRAAPPPGTPTRVRSPDEPHTVRIYKDERGFKLKVNGEDTMVFGMNWAYMPIGQNYSYDFWSKPDDFIKEALEGEMTLLRDMGVNALRVYVGIPQRWITYIYETYGIYTILNHSMGRYGFSMNGAWIFPTNYGDPKQRDYIKKEILELVDDYKDTPGLLFWLLGNENNYGLFWEGTETNEDLPVDQQADALARPLYSLFGEVIDGIHGIDKRHPVAIANGDLQFIDLIAKEAPNLDILGSNVYRGRSSGDLFQVVQDKLNIPFVYTEFGADAYDAKRKKEDHLTQADYLHALWQEIYEQSYGKGRVGNAIGGMTFQWSDGWWKYKQESNLDIHDNTASWANAAYPEDLAEGQNNMNEEWFGICAKGPNNEKGIYEVYPRTAYYVLKKACALDPYASDTTLEAVRNHFAQVRPKELGGTYGVELLNNRMDVLEIVRVKNLTLEFTTFTTGGDKLTVPNRNQDRNVTRFDHMQSFYADFEVKPFDKVRANLSINVLGNVATNPIDEIYFENRGLVQEVRDGDGENINLTGLQRIKVYQATFEWKDKYFDMEGFYRAGHGHWGYEGDFFGIFPEAHYQPAVDLFNADTPSGMIFTGKKFLSGFKVAFGPELWWGANPTIVAKYYRKKGHLEFSLMHQEDVAQRADAGTSSVLPVPKTRKTALYIGYQVGALKIDIGGLMAGTDRLDRHFQAVEEAPDGAPSYLDSGFYLLEDRIKLLDTFGGKVKLTYNGGIFNWYMQAGYRGLVADAGPNPTLTFAGYGLRESGQGNHYSLLSGMLFNAGTFQIAPNFLYQKPLEGPLPLIEDFFDPNTGNFFPGVRARNQFDDPFWVRSNRETIGFEFLIAHDPTPASWMWAWNAVEREDAPFAAMLDFVYRILPTSQDGGVAISAEGFPFAFSSAAPARNLWEVRGRLFGNPMPKLRLVSDFYAGIAQSTGDDDRLIKRGGIYGRMLYEQISAEAWIKVNDWGPFDYYRDFNQTFPVQMIGDLSYSVGLPQWFVRAYTRLGIRGKLRFLDENSGRFDSTRTGTGREWEIMTYVHISI